MTKPVTIVAVLGAALLAAVPAGAVPLPRAAAQKACGVAGCVLPPARPAWRPPVTREVAAPRRPRTALEAEAQGRAQLDALIASLK